MQRLLVSLAATACLVALLGAAAPAHAAFATFVSADGNDANTCLSPATACREIGGATGALSKTDSGGVVHVLPGEYDAFAIPANLSVGIIAEGGLASVLDGSVPIPGGGVASILINNTNSQNVVRIRGLEIESFGTPIAVVGNETTLHVERCVLVPLSGAGLYGIDFQPGGSLLTHLFVSDTIISRQVGTRTATGIRIRPTSSAGVTAVLDNVRIGDLGTGILIDSRFTTGSNAVTIRNSTISGSASFGLATYESGSGTSTVTIEGSNISNNTASFGVGMSGAGATARLLNSAVIGNARGLLAASSSSIISNGGNVIAGNTINGAFTSTVPPQ
jgi:hypothetical protein